MAYLKPQSPLRHKDGDYFYPLTTADQVVMPDGSRLNSVFKHTVRTNITLLASNWSSNAPYKQTIALNDYLDNLKVDANIVYSGIEETDLGLNKAASCLSYIKKNGKNIIFYCLSNKPEINIPIEISYETINNIADVTVIDGIKLNFKVLGGINQPTTTAENTIWIQTDDEENIVIEHWIFSAEEPVNPIDNMIWIMTGVSSPVKFDAIKDNDIQLYPIFAKQYIGGAWVDKEAKSYQGGEWVDWCTYLYKYGDQRISLTGGWKDMAYTDTTTTVDFNQDHILITGASSKGTELSVTLNKVNISGYKQVCAELDMTSILNESSYSSGIRILTSNNGDMSDIEPVTIAAARTTTLGEQIVKCDISDINVSEAYISVYSYRTITKFSRIWLE